MPDSSAYLAVAEAAAREAGLLALERRKTLGPARAKGIKDLVTEADIECDRLIRSRLTAAFPEHDLLTEEEGTLENGSEYRWIVDPIDGTINYARGIPLWGVSVGLAHRGRALCGAIYLPVFDEMYTAALGGGAFLNGAPIRVSALGDLQAAALSHGDFNVGDDAIRGRLNDENALALARAIPAVQRIKSLGSAVVEGAYVATGRLDAYWMTYLRPWDVAVTTLLVTEAGGRVTDLSGNPWTLDREEALFTNGVLHETMVRALDWGKRGE